MEKGIFEEEDKEVPWKKRKMRTMRDELKGRRSKSGSEK